MATFRKELECLINRTSKEDTSNTPDWILANFLSDCLAAFDNAVDLRTHHYAKENGGKITNLPPVRMEHKYPRVNIHG